MKNPNQQLLEYIMWSLRHSNFRVRASWRNLVLILLAVAVCLIILEINGFFS